MAAKKAKSEIVRIRITQELREQINSAKMMGAHTSADECDFLRYLVEVGLVKYEASILPAERADSPQEFTRRVINE